MYIMPKSQIFNLANMSINAIRKSPTLQLLAAIGFWLLLILPLQTVWTQIRNDTLIVILKEFLENVDFEKSQMTKKSLKITQQAKS